MSTEGTGSLTLEQLKELQELCGDMISDAEKLVEDYEENPSEESGSVYRIHENSPFLDENFTDTGWKHVLKTDIPTPEMKVKTGEDVLENLNKKDVDNKENNS